LPNSALQNNSITLGSTSVALGSTVAAVTGLNNVGTATVTMSATGAPATTVQSSPANTAAWTLTLPTSPGANHYLLQTDGTGVTSWTQLDYESLVNSTSNSPWPTSSCAAGSFLTWSSVQDGFTCSPITSGMVTS